jgi:chemotaxis response regulator CheB
MPKEAIKIGAAAEIASLPAIAHSILHALSREAKASCQPDVEIANVANS